ncbi:hypothetical protein Hanom_Chr17g01590581 [Helianthus anomalus]
MLIKKTDLLTSYYKFVNHELLHLCYTISLCIISMYYKNVQLYNKCTISLFFKRKQFLTNRHDPKPVLTRQNCP